MCKPGLELHEQTNRKKHNQSMCVLVNLHLFLRKHFQDIVEDCYM